ncbi:hypothetical protein Dsin_029625 [Dipteronia sinensis]|uniref:Uncharacterized protein n=1 Tax=Dipteronia sinensis TaxID=43782 RepID=A0AAD9ZTF5_9ROSI|nr:hypothetical protein Dsin_029625 [Dipteronia sinensis]
MWCVSAALRPKAPWVGHLGLQMGAGLPLSLEAGLSHYTFFAPVKAPTFSPEPPQQETEKVEEETSKVKKKMKHTADSSSVKRQTRQSHRQSIDDAGDTFESLSLNNEKAASESSGKDMKNTTDIVDLFADKNSPDEPMPKEFVSALDSLVDSLTQPRSETPLPQTVTVNSPSKENDLAAAQSKLNLFPFRYGFSLLGLL